MMQCYFYITGYIFLGNNSEKNYKKSTHTLTVTCENFYVNIFSSKFFVVYQILTCFQLLNTCAKKTFMRSIFVVFGDYKIFSTTKFPQLRYIVFWHSHKSHIHQQQQPNFVVFITVTSCSGQALTSSTCTVNSHTCNSQHNSCQQCIVHSCILLTS